MRLNHFILILTLTYAVVASGGFLIYRIYVVYPTILEFALKSHQDDIQALNRTLSSEKEHLRLLVIDWAKWDDLYWFVDTPNDVFRQSNLVPSTFTDANLSGAYITDLDKHLIFGLELPYGAEDTIEVPENSPDYQILSAIAFPNDDDSYCNYIHLTSVLTLYCVASAQDSEVENSGNGYLMFTRHAGDGFVNHLKTVTGTKFRVLKENDLPVNVMAMADSKKIKVPKSVYFLGFSNDSDDYDFVIELTYDEASLPKIMDTQTYLFIFGLLFLPITIFLGMRYFLIKPLVNMSELILNMKSKKEMPKFKSFGFIFEVKVFNKSIYESMEKMKEEKKYLKMLSLTDALTGINNRRAFDIDISLLWKKASRHQNPIAIIIIDIDFFKQYNDALGHIMGDQAIQSIALALKNACRRVNDKAYRYGGEEFAITMELDAPSDLETVLTSIMDAVRNLHYPHPSSSISKYITVSLGACLIVYDSGVINETSFADAIKKADEALYEAKQSGRDRFVYHRLNNYQ